MRILKALLLGLLLFVIVTFSIKNAGNVSVRYFGLTGAFEIPLFLVVLLSVLLGMFIGTMVDLFMRYRMKKAIQKQQNIMDVLQREIRSVRNRILTGPDDGEKDT